MTLKTFIQQRFGPFGYRSFRAFYFVQAVSLIGNWMQEIARSWIVLSLAGQASHMGALLVASALPSLFLGGLGGSLADSRDYRGILMVTQVGLATSAFALGLVVSQNQVELWHLLVFAILEGTILAFDMPAFYKVTPRLVPPEHFRQALALNSVNFHLSRVIGPSIAGLIMGVSGPAMVFWINSISFLGVLIVIARLPRLEVSSEDTSDQSRKMREAISYLRKNPFLFRVLVQLVLIIALVFPLVFTTFRVYFQKKFGLDSKDFGLMFAIPGFGALCGSLTFLLWSPKNPFKALPFGLCGVILFLVLLAESDRLIATMVALGLFSFSIFLALSSLTVTIQLHIENRYRGRVSALIGMTFVSLAPIMSGPMGVLSDIVGEKGLMWSVAISLLISSLALAGVSRIRRAPAQIENLD